MEKLGLEMESYLADMDVSQSKIVTKMTVLYRCFCAMNQVFPDAATCDYILSHINGFYLVKDESPRKGSADSACPVLCTIYSDDSLVKAELDARQELLRRALHAQQIHFDEYRFLSSKGGMRQRHPFDQFIEKRTNVCSKITSPEASKQAQKSQEKELWQAFKRACCKTFGVAAKPILDDVQKVEWSRLKTYEQTRVNYRAKRSCQRTLHCYEIDLWVDDPQTKKVFEQSASELLRETRNLGAMVIAMKIHSGA